MIRMSGLKSPAKVKCTIAPTPTAAFTMVVHHQDSPWAVVSAANTVSGGAVVSNTWRMVFNSSLLRHDGLGGGQNLFGCRDHVVGLAAVFLGNGDQLLVGAAGTPAAVICSLLLHAGLLRSD